MSDQFLGEIRMFGGAFAPLDWAFCDGRSMSISQNEALFQLIGTTYGGDGVTTFNLPDLRGRVPIGRGAAPNLSPYPIGQKGGADLVVLEAKHVGLHTHRVNAQSTASTVTSPDNGFWAASSVGEFSTGQGNATMNASNVLPAGTSSPQGHENRMPYLTVTFIIALNGDYPTRS